MVPDNPKKGFETCNPRYREAKVKLDLFPRVLRLITVAVLLVGCAPSPGDLFEKMMETNDNEEFRFLCADAVDLGKDSIPIFLAILSREIPEERRLSLIELTKTGRSIQGLSDLARQGIYSIHAIPILLRHMGEDLIRLDISLGPAETLKLITGIDVGYNEQFVADYTEAEEPRRKEMLAAWRAWYEQEVAKERESGIAR
jgi:hypothetical protein